MRAVLVEPESVPSTRASLTIWRQFSAIAVVRCSNVLSGSSWSCRNAIHSSSSRRSNSCMRRADCSRRFFSRSSNLASKRARRCSTPSFNRTGAPAITAIIREPRSHDVRCSRPYGRISLAAIAKHCLPAPCDQKSPRCSDARANSAHSSYASAPVTTYAYGASVCGSRA